MMIEQRIELLEARIELLEALILKLEKTICSVNAQSNTWTGESRLPDWGWSD